MSSGSDVRKRLIPASTSDTEVWSILPNKQENREAAHCQSESDLKTCIREECVEATLRLREEEYSYYTAGDVWVGTWNVNGCFSKKEIEMWLGRDGDSPYSLYVVGLQEMVPLNPLTVLFNIHVKTTQKKWLDAIQSILEEKYGCSFNCIASQTLTGISLFLLSPSTSPHSFSNVQATFVPTGFYGLLGNKGGIGISLTIDHTRVHIICSHLPPHKQGMGERECAFHKIWNAYSSQSKHLYCENDITLWMGDLNYRLDVDEKPSTLASTIQNDYAALIPHDQLVKLRNSGGAFSDFHEGRIEFPPTYKYKKGGSQFNWKRTPAWCDRILCRGDCVVSSYACVSETTCSDHKPVMAVVEFQLKEFDEEKKEEAKETIEKKILQTEEGNVCVSMSTRSIQFGVVRVGTPQHQHVVLKNEGEANAYFRVAGELAASPARGLVLPGDSVDVDLAFCISPREARWRRRWGCVQRCGEVTVEVVGETPQTVEWEAAWEAPCPLVALAKGLFTRRGWILLECVAVYLLLECLDAFFVSSKHPNN